MTRFDTGDTTGGMVQSCLLDGKEVAAILLAYDVDKGWVDVVTLVPDPNGFVEFDGHKWRTIRDPKTGRVATQREHGKVEVVLVDGADDAT